MTCQDREQDLLMLAHGELSLWRRLPLLAHLRRCASCRQRRERLADVSVMVAGAIRSAERPPWAPPTDGRSSNRLVGRPPGLRLVILALTLAAFGALAYALIARVHRTDMARPGTPPSSSAGGCLPNLPNDRCR
jgi:anti-sigma factor RsiW